MQELSRSMLLLMRVDESLHAETAVVEYLRRKHPALLEGVEVMHVTLAHDRAAKELERWCTWRAS